MSASNVELGNVEYIYLRNVDCNGGTGGDLADVFQWDFPRSINPRQAPYMFIQVVQLYVDHDDGAGIAQPQHLSYTTLNGVNAYSSGSSSLASLMERDDLAGHWTAQGDAPMIQVPSSVSNLNFTLNRNLNGNAITLGTSGSIDIVLKIVWPKQNEITNNTLSSFVRTF